MFRLAFQVKNIYQNHLKITSKADFRRAFNICGGRRMGFRKQILNRGSSMLPIFSKIFPYLIGVVFNARTFSLKSFYRTIVRNSSLRASGRLAFSLGVNRRKHLPALVLFFVLSGLSGRTTVDLHKVKNRLDKLKTNSNGAFRRDFGLRLCDLGMKHPGFGPLLSCPWMPWLSLTCSAHPLQGYHCHSYVRRLL